MTSIQASLLDIRKNPAKYFAKADKTPVTVTKRGKKVAVVIDLETAEEFWQWKERKKLKKLYFESKKEFEKYGSQFLQSKNLKQSDLDLDQLVELVTNA